MAIYKFSNKNYEPSSASKKIGISLLVLCTLCFVALFTNLLLFMRSFLMGTFGLFAYPLFISLFIVGLALINNKKYILGIKYVVYLALVIISILAILQLILIDNSGLSFFQYLGKCYTKQITAGGIIIGLIVAPILYILNTAGAYIIFAISTIIFSALMFDYLYYQKDEIKAKKSVKVMQSSNTAPKILEKDKYIKSNFNVVLDGYLQNENKNNKINEFGVLAGEDFGKLGELSRKEYLLTPPEINIDAYLKTYNKNEITKNIEQIKNDNNDDISTIKEHEDILTSIKENDINKGPEKNNNFANKILQDILSDTNEIDINSQSKTKPINLTRNERRSFKQMNFDNTDDIKENIADEININEKNEASIVKKDIKYNRPPLDLLTTKSVDLSTLNEDVVEKRAMLENALETFGIPAKVINVVVGPAVTRYELEMPPGISVKKITAHADDIALVLASNGNIRIEAPIPGKSAVGVEVPNNKIATVSFKEILMSDEFQKSAAPLILALGKDISGAVRVCNLEKMPHLLVAGSTNSGKSVCLNAIILSLVYRLTPDEVKLVLVDPKRVEFSAYNGLPHLLIPTVISEIDKVVNMFNYCIDEMERRYLVLEETKCKNISEYNQLPDVVSKKRDKLPYIVVVVDELADLMVMAKKDIEDKIMRLAQKARASGIHLVFATQRPSVDVVTGTIKVNFPSRISFSLMSFADSKTVLDQSGAEKLLGRGDMLYKPNDLSEPRRVQGCFATTDEINQIVEYVKEHNKEYEYSKEIELAIFPPKVDKEEVQGGGYLSSTTAQRNGTEYDPILPEVLKYFIEANQASISMIQRRFVVGYPKAAKIIDQLERLGYISKQDGTKPRSVLISMSEYQEIFER